jgi:hypothetical protein
MREPIVLALISAASAVLGGLLVAFGKPIGEDLLARRAEDRAQATAREADARKRVDRVAELLAIVEFNGMHAKKGSAVSELAMAARATGARELIGLVDAIRGYEGIREAQRRAGDLLGER